MRHTLVVAIVLALCVIAWRVHCVLDSGRQLHADEQAGRATAEAIQDAEEAARLRKLGAPDEKAPYEYLSSLVASGRVKGLTRVESPERDLWRSGAYLFHVVLVNKLGRPIAKPPADPSSEPGLGARFQLWAWPAERDDAVLALFFANSSGYLLQGDNGTFAGVDARPEDAGDAPIHAFEQKSVRADGQWIALRHVRGE